jgi:hypothetical protein
LFLESAYTAGIGILGWCGLRELSMPRGSSAGVPYPLSRSRSGQGRAIDGLLRLGVVAGFDRDDLIVTDFVLIAVFHLFAGELDLFLFLGAREVHGVNDSVEDAAAAVGFPIFGAVMDQQNCSLKGVLKFFTGFHHPRHIDDTVLICARAARREGIKDEKFWMDLVLVNQRNEVGHLFLVCEVDWLVVNVEMLIHKLIHLLCSAKSFWIACLPFA